MIQTETNHNQTNVSTIGRWASVLGGGTLLLIAIRRRSRSRLIPAAVGAGLLYQGVTGHSRLYQAIGVNTADQAAGSIRVQKTVTVLRAPAEAYQFWRQLENLPRFMTHLESVEPLGNGRSRWVVRMPGDETSFGLPLTWEAQITVDQPNEMIAWETLPGSEVQHSGIVRFRPAPRDRGTEVTVILSYDPPGGVVGDALARLLNVVTEQQIKEEIRRFKAVLEAGETATIEGQPAGERSTFPLGVNIVGIT